MKQKSKILFFHAAGKNMSVLLGKRVLETGETFWWLPGGGVEAGEKLLEAAVREIHEELVPDIHLSKILQNCLVLADKIPFISYSTEKSNNTVFFVKLPSPDLPGIRDEFIALKWFPIQALPGNMSREFQHISKQVVANYLSGLEYLVDYNLLLR